MLIVGIIFLTLAVLFGLIILSSILQNKRTPKPIVFLHGAVALFAILVIIGYIASGHTSPLIVASLVFFLIAAMGGLTLLIFDIKKKPIAKLIVLVHPLIAFLGVITLITYMMQQAAISQ